MTCPGSGTSFCPHKDSACSDYWPISRMRKQVLWNLSKAVLLPKGRTTIDVLVYISLFFLPRIALAHRAKNLGLWPILSFVTVGSVSKLLSSMCIFRCPVIKHWKRGVFFLLHYINVCLILVTIHFKDCIFITSKHNRKMNETIEWTNIPWPHMCNFCTFTFPPTPEGYIY